MLKDFDKTDDGKTISFMEFLLIMLGLAILLVDFNIQTRELNNRIDKLIAINLQVRTQVDSLYKAHDYLFYTRRK